MNHFDSRIASLHSALRDCADLVSDFRADRDKARALAANHETTIKRYHETILALREENEELKQMLSWMNTGHRENAA
jgi:hypothetical protein